MEVFEAKIRRRTQKNQGVCTIGICSQRDILRLDILQTNDVSCKLHRTPSVSDYYIFIYQIIK